MRYRGLLTGLLIFVGLCASACGPDQEEATAATDAFGLQLEVYTSPESGYSVTSTIVSGATEALVIDPQFLASEARKVGDRIREMGKKLTLIYTTHAHPDHFFGVAALKEQFPEARYVALPEVAERIATAWPARHEFWLSTYGDELPGPEPILPEPLAVPEMIVDGKRLTITGGLFGDAPDNSFVYIPTLNALIAGDIVFNHAHFAVPERPEQLYVTIDRIERLDPLILVAGHKAPGARDEAGAIQWMRNYIASWINLKQEAQSAAELKEGMMILYPDAVLVEEILDREAKRAFGE